MDRILANWTTRHADLAESIGLYTAFQHARGMGIIRIWMGMPQTGPRLQWDKGSNKWIRLISNGNYGKRYAYGGTWREDKPLSHKGHIYYDTIRDADPIVYFKLRIVACAVEGSEEK